MLTSCEQPRRWPVLRSPWNVRKAGIAGRGRGGGGVADSPPPSPPRGGLLPRPAGLAGEPIVAPARRVAPWPYGDGELSAREVLGPPAREKHAGERRRQGLGAAGGARTALNRGCDEVGAPRATRRLPRTRGSRPSARRGPRRGPEPFAGRLPPGRGQAARCSRGLESALRAGRPSRTRIPHHTTP